MKSANGWLGGALACCGFLLVGCSGSDDGVEPPPPPPPATRNAREVASGGGRLTAGTMTIDVQVGHPFGQKPSVSGSARVEGGAAVKP